MALVRINGCLQVGGNYKLALLVCGVGLIMVVCISLIIFLWFKAGLMK